MAERVEILGIFAVLAAILTCGCMGPAPSGQPGPFPVPTVAAPLVVAINATPPRYNLAMSSTIGIRLTPVNTSGIIPQDAQFTWQTNFGGFYHWGASDFKVTELGSKYTGTEEPVYWSFFAEQSTKESPLVTVNLKVTEPSTGEILANASLGIGWDGPNGFTAVVEDSD